MSISTQELATLWTWLPGWYDNQAQALAEPVWYVHLWLWQRVIPGGIQGHLALFIEQAQALTPERPYRQRVLVLTTEQAQYYACREPERWRGCGQEPERLVHLTDADVVPLPGCVLDLTCANGAFHARLRPGYRCEFDYQGQKRQVELGWQVTATTFTSYDRGLDPQTGQVRWGALMGPYVFHKRA